MTLRHLLALLRGWLMTLQPPVVLSRCSALIMRQEGSPLNLKYLAWPPESTGLKRPQ